MLVTGLQGVKIKLVANFKFTKFVHATKFILGHLKNVENSSVVLSFDYTSILLNIVFSALV